LRVLSPATMLVCLQRLPQGTLRGMNFTGASVLRSRSLVMAQTSPIVSGVDVKGVLFASNVSRRGRCGEVRNETLQ